jgi:hypothetical protein
MNRHVKNAQPKDSNVRITGVAPSDIAPAEWQARVDLAATYQLIAHYGWGDVIYNH